MARARRDSETAGNPAGKSVWGPLLLRGLAAGIALAGLAGIGVAASRSPELAPLPAAALPGVQLAGLSSSAPLGLPPSGAALAAGASARRAVDAGAAPARLCPCEQAPRAPCGQGRRPAASSEPVALGRVNLNRASSSELMKLPGVGARRAQAIVELRERLGGFRRAGDLLRIKGIGPRMLERMLPHVTLDAEVPPPGPPPAK